VKIITSAALMDQAGLTPDSAASCTDSLTTKGQIFHSDPACGPTPAPRSPRASPCPATSPSSRFLRGYSALQGGGNGLLGSRAASGYSPCGRRPVPRTVRDLYARPWPAGDNQAGQVYRRAGGMSGLWSWRKTAGRTNVPRRSFGAAAVDEAESSLREE
jgi:hypothetical protein